MPATRDLFSLNVDLMLFDTTSIYFEGQGVEGLEEYGYAKDHRPDRLQVVLGLLMSRDGMPVAHHVFPGNTADITAFRHAIADLRRRFSIRRVVIIADRGVVSKRSLAELEQDGMEYIVGMPLRRWKEERDRKERESIVAMLEEQLSRGGLAGLARSKGWRRYLKVMEAGQAEIDQGRVGEEARYDGKYVLRAKTSLPAEEVAVDYKSLWQVEHAFRELKSGLEVRPVYLAHRGSCPWSHYRVLPCPGVVGQSAAYHVALLPVSISLPCCCGMPFSSATTQL